MIVDADRAACACNGISAIFNRSTSSDTLNETEKSFFASNSEMGNVSQHNFSRRPAPRSLIPGGCEDVRLPP